MVTHCANPACAVPLRYLRDGRLFQFEVRSRIQPRKLSRQVAHFWLCGMCSGTMTLTFDPAMGVQVIPMMPLPAIGAIQLPVST
ncbi:MAG: hypothetical protein JOZ80_02310 [Acidobacteriaceae bacterium]|nr:hypothetical protein [Acidobacteriaceae bacterium]